MKKLILAAIASALLLGWWYVQPAIEQYHEDVQGYHERNLLPE